MSPSDDEERGGSSGRRREPALADGALLKSLDRANSVECRYRGCHQIISPPCLVTVTVLKRAFTGQSGTHPQNALTSRRRTV